MIMIRRFGIILTVLTLVFSFCAFSGIAVSEAALELDENEVYGLVQSADIEIPVFTAENMNQIAMHRKKIHISIVVSFPRLEFL